MENQKMKEKLELFLNGSLAVRQKTDDKREKKVGRKRGKNAPAQVETLIEEGKHVFIQKEESSVSARSPMKDKLTCLNARSVASGTTSNAWDSLAQSKMLSPWNSHA